MTEQNFLQLEAMDAKVKAEEQRRVWGLFGDADPMVHTFDLYRSHYPPGSPLPRASHGRPVRS